MIPLISIPKKVVLASASPRRKELLTRMNLSFTVFPSHAEESGDELNSLSASDQACVLAARKAEDAASRLNQDCLVIGADTIVVKDGYKLGKPQNQEQGAAMLQFLQGGWHFVYTGVALIDRKINYRDTAWESTTVEMMKLTDDEIKRYTDSGEYRDKAGGYAIQGLAAAFIPGIEGCYFNVVGLPVHLLYVMLQKYLSFLDGRQSGY
ncbi:MAG: Maf family protein [Caldicoprobacterales bacterium]|jgi:septum formation protein|nr:septum formation protein Maf [Clostridiales bacterium]